MIRGNGLSDNDRHPQQTEKKDKLTRSVGIDSDIEERNRRCVRDLFGPTKQDKKIYTFFSLSLSLLVWLYAIAAGAYHSWKQIQTIAIYDLFISAIRDNTSRIERMKKRIRSNFSNQLNVYYDIIYIIPQLLFGWTAARAPCDWLLLYGRRERHSFNNWIPFGFGSWAGARLCKVTRPGYSIRQDLLPTRLLQVGFWQESRARSRARGQQVWKDLQDSWSFLTVAYWSSPSIIIPTAVFWNTIRRTNKKYIDAFK